MMLYNYINLFFSGAFENQKAFYISSCTQIAHDYLMKNNNYIFRTWLLFQYFQIVLSLLIAYSSYYFVLF